MTKRLAWTRDDFDSLPRLRGTVPLRVDHLRETGTHSRWPPTVLWPPPLQPGFPPHTNAPQPIAHRVTLCPGPVSQHTQQRWVAAKAVRAADRLRHPKIDRVLVSRDAPTSERSLLG